MYKFLMYYFGSPNNIGKDMLLSITIYKKIIFFVSIITYS